MKNPIYKTYLTNGIIASSDSCNFTQIPKYPINSIHLYLPNGRSIAFDGFEQYLVIKTNYMLLQTNKNKFDTLSFLCLYNDTVYQLTYHSKGIVMQRKNNAYCWSPLILKPKPMIDNKKQFDLKFAESVKIEKDKWHIGLKKKTCTVRVKG